MEDDVFRTRPDPKRDEKKDLELFSILSEKLPIDAKEENDLQENILKEMRDILKIEILNGDVERNDVGEVKIIESNAGGILYKHAVQENFHSPLSLYLFSKTVYAKEKFGGDWEKLHHIIINKLGVLLISQGVPEFARLGRYYKNANEPSAAKIVPIIERVRFLHKEVEYCLSHTIVGNIMRGDRIILYDRRGRSAHLIFEYLENGELVIFVNVDQSLQGRSLASLLYKEAVLLAKRYGHKYVVSEEIELLEPEITHHIRDSHLIIEKIDDTRVKYVGVQGEYSSLFKEGILEEDISILNKDQEEDVEFAGEEEDEFNEDIDSDFVEDIYFDDDGDDEWAMIENDIDIDREFEENEYDRTNEKEIAKYDLLDKVDEFGNPSLDVMIALYEEVMGA